MKGALGAAIAVAAILQGPIVRAQPAAPAAAAAPPARQPSVPYGPTITLDQARKAAAGAEAEARRRNANISIAIAGPTGTIVYFEHMDGALYATDQLATIKARNSAQYRWPTSNFVTMLKNGQAFPDVFVGPGGMPLVIDGKTVGAIGVSGAADDQIAQMGVDALK